MIRTFRKINLQFLFIVILLASCKKDEPETSGFKDIRFPNENELSWDYPIIPGSEKWKTFQSYAEKVEALQIPSAILTKLTTEELVLICLKYPLLMDIGAFNFFPDGYAAFETNFNGIRSLYQRSDAPSTLFAWYKQLNFEDASLYSTISFVFKVSVVEYILTSPAVISKLSATQRKEVATELHSKLNFKRSQPGNFPATYQNSTYRALIKIIKCDAKGELPADDTNLADYFAGGFVAPEKAQKDVAEMIRLYFAAR